MFSFSRKKKSLPIIGMTRVRNEALIIKDTIKHLESFCDGIVVYDDCSTDETVSFVKRYATKLLHLEQGDKWLTNRLKEETRHRDLLMDIASSYSPEWFFYADADERFVGNIREVLVALPKKIHGVRIQLFDAYMTEKFNSQYVSGSKLENMERLYGPERRDILMAWRNSGKFNYVGLDAREPQPTRSAKVITADLYCKHFGKAISVEQWEETCNYYASHFPEPYASKWAARRGKAIHTLSDFGRPLYIWDQVRQHAIPM